MTPAFLQACFPKCIILQASMFSARPGIFSTLFLVTSLGSSLLLGWDLSRIASHGPSHCVLLHARAQLSIYIQRHLIDPRSLKQTQYSHKSKMKARHKGQSKLVQSKANLFVAVAKSTPSTRAQLQLEKLRVCSIHI